MAAAVGPRDRVAVSGPLDGVQFVELAGIGPGPFCGMVLADFGARGVIVDRAGRTPPADPEVDPLMRGRRSIVLDLKQPAGRDVLLRLVEQADVLIDPFRPGVAERLGIGPESCCSRNPGLVYARMTGWGQEGPYAPNAGHDINFIALAGALEGIGLAGNRPTPPQNLVADFGGGGMLLALGVVAALFERQRSGLGQVVDAAMVDGTALLTAFVRGLQADGRWPGPRGTNFLDGGAHFYDTYETADGKWVAVGCIEGPFYERLLACLGLDGDDDLVAGQWDRERWPEHRRRLAAVFRTRTRDEWCALLEPEPDVCFAPVLALGEAPQHPHLRARSTFTDVGGMVQPAPAPRFSRTPAAAGAGGARPGRHTDEVLAELGFGQAEIARLRAAGAAG